MKRMILVAIPFLAIMLASSCARKNSNQQEDDPKPIIDQVERVKIIIDTVFVERMVAEPKVKAVVNQANLDEIAFAEKSLADSLQRILESRYNTEPVDSYRAYLESTRKDYAIEQNSNNGYNLTDSYSDYDNGYYYNDYDYYNNDHYYDEYFYEDYTPIYPQYYPVYWPNKPSKPKYPQEPTISYPSLKQQKPNTGVRTSEHNNSNVTSPVLSGLPVRTSDRGADHRNLASPEKPIASKPGESSRPQREGQKEDKNIIKTDIPAQREIRSSARGRQSEERNKASEQIKAEEVKREAREARERSEREAQERHDREEREYRDKVARETQERRERDERERSEREASERREREESERRDREENQRREQAERESREQREREERERSERQAREQREREAKEREEKEKKEKSERESRERAAQERRDKEERERKEAVSRSSSRSTSTSSSSRSSENSSRSSNRGSGRR